MLGSERFAFETPNVIDPGDLPPSAPRRDKRSESHSHTSSTHSDSSGDGSSEDYQEAHKTRLLRDIADLDLSPTEPYDPYDEEHAEAPGRSLPHVEEARAFATSLLSAPTSPTSKEGLGRTVQIDAPSSRQHHLVRKRILRVGGRTCLAVLGIVVVIAVAVSLMNKRNSSSYSNTDSGGSWSSKYQTPRHEQIVKFLINNDVSSRIDLATRDSPQYMAANWIADEDGLVLDTPHNLFTDFRFVQRYVLAVFFFAMQGATWDRHANFLTKQHECAWFKEMSFDAFVGAQYAVGVTCDAQTFQVKDIFLPHNSLQGQLPTELQHLSQLQMLAVGGNAISGTIPSQLKVLTNLHFLDLKYNSMTGDLPYWIGDFANLEVLGLSNNNLAGTVPPSYATLGRLHTLALDDNMLSGSIDFVNKLTNLEFFYADRNMFSGEMGASFMSELDRLRELDLSSNEITSTVLPTHFFQHPTLHVLDLANNLIEASFPAQIDVNTELDFLSLRGNKMRGQIPSTLSSLSTLRHLDLHNNSFTGYLPLDLDKVTGLTYLFLGENDFFPSEMPPFLDELRNLRELSLTAMQIDGDIPEWLGRYLTNLRYLDLSHNQLKSTIPSSLGEMTELEYLLLNNNQLSGQVPTWSSPDLKILALHRNLQLSGNAGLVCSAVDSIHMVTVDCNTAVTCSTECCPTCCDDDDKCFEQELNDALTASEGLWELGYTRAPFAFDPDILDDTGLFTVIEEQPTESPFTNSEQP